MKLTDQKMPTEQDMVWLKANPEGVKQIYLVGLTEGAKMKWPEMLFWICLIVWLMNLATGGV